MVWLNELLVGELRIISEFPVHLSNDKSMPVGAKVAIGSGLEYCIDAQTLHHYIPLSLYGSHAGKYSGCLDLGVVSFRNRTLASISVLMKKELGGKQRKVMYDPALDIISLPDRTIYIGQKSFLLKGFKK